MNDLFNFFKKLLIALKLRISPSRIVFIANRPYIIYTYMDKKTKKKLNGIVDKKDRRLLVVYRLKV